MVNKKDICFLKQLLDGYAEYPSFVGVVINNVNTKGNFNEQPIHLAVLIGKISDIEILLNNGADINAKGEHGYTPLQEAIEQENLEVISFLLNHKADIYVKNDEGYNAMDLAEIIGNQDIIKLLAVAL